MNIPTRSEDNFFVAFNGSAKSPISMKNFETGNKFNPIDFRLNLGGNMTIVTVFFLADSNSIHSARNLGNI